MELDAIRRVIEEIKFKVRKDINITQQGIQTYIVIVESLEKQIPKQINLDNGNCPNCKYDMYRCNYKDNYCPNCGQKIDWN